MEIVLENNVKKLIPTEKEYLLAREDFNKPEKERYYFQMAYLPQPTTIEECKNLYMEVEMGDETAFLHLTRGDVFRGIYQAKGIKREQIRALIEAMPDETKAEIDTKELASIDFDEALYFYRGNPLIDQLGEQLGISSEQMTQFFETNDWHTLIN